MRKVLAITITAAVLFAVGAFAATITNVTGEDISSGSDGIGSCADTANVDFTIGGYTAGTTNDWAVTHAVVSLKNGTEAATACNGARVTVVVKNQANTSLNGNGNSATVVSATANVALTAGIFVGQVHGVSVLIDGTTVNSVTFSANTLPS
jgi:hypothetical protein